jgi:hypothetical protein
LPAPDVDPPDHAEDGPGGGVFVFFLVLVSVAVLLAFGWPQQTERASHEGVEVELSTTGYDGYREARE